ncbi:hypothetical protein ACOJBM_36710 [Rhizobium beringeri]
MLPMPFHRTGRRVIETAIGYPIKAASKAVPAPETTDLPIRKAKTGLVNI